MMGRLTPQIVVFLVTLLSLSRVHGSNTGVRSKPSIRCKEVERRALLKFKEGLYEKDNNTHLLSSWGTEEEKRECCEWVGIRCDNKSGHVITLDLSPSTFGIGDYYTYNPLLQGNYISSSLLELSYLSYLSLEFVSFNTKIPSFIGNLSKLRYLNLANTKMRGEVPPLFANLSNLQFLDLSNNIISLDSSYIRNMDWISSLSSLRELVLSGQDLSKVSNWMKPINKLPYLTKLELRACRLRDIPSSLSPNSSSSSSSLSFLDLSINSLSISTYQWFSSFSPRLVHLDFSSTSLEGAIPTNFSPSLVHLDLSSNKLDGSIPNAIGNMTALAYLDLNYNQLTGVLPKSIGQLTQLEVLDISSNSLEGVLSEAHFSKLSMLYYLDLSSNKNLVLSVPSDWIPPFQLDVIRLGSCKLGPQFPKWLRTQKNFSGLDFSNSGISDSIPNWFWNSYSHLTYLNLAKNQIRGTIANYSLKGSLVELNLSSNQFEGPIPFFSYKIQSLALSNNKFSSLKSLCDVTDNAQLMALDISENRLEGKLPDCWSRFKNLRNLNLANNNLSGKFPNSIGTSSELLFLHLGGNNFTGELPSSLKKCTKLLVLDMGKNRLVGPIPMWIGEILQSLIILSLRSNQFYGNMPQNLCHLANLQLLDLSLNDISESIPNCIGNLSMKNGGFGTFFSSMILTLWAERMLIMWKGILSEYNNTLGLVVMIDLSSNKLIGEVPKEITQLYGLVSLNLSRNNLSGQIPTEIGQLNSLDALDLSCNQFSGKIPSSLSKVDRLSFLNLSSNNLSGKIPTGTQIQSFDPDRYMGNPHLCGPPLLKKCLGEEPTTSIETKYQDSFISRGFYVSVALGFAFGFWGFCATL